MGLSLSLVPKLRSVAQNEWKNNHIYFILCLVQKQTSLSGKNQKKTKKFQKPKSFQGRDVELGGFLHKSQHTQGNFEGFESWTGGWPQWLAGVRVFKVEYFILSL